MKIVYDSFLKENKQSYRPNTKGKQQQISVQRWPAQSPAKQFLAAEFPLLFVLNTIACSKTNRILNGIVAVPVYINFQYFIMV